MRRLLIVDRQGKRVFLRSPDVGTFTCIAAEGTVLTPGTKAGVLHRLDVAYDLMVPEGVTGRVSTVPPERVHAPVEFGAVLYELVPFAQVVGDETVSDDKATPLDGLAVRAPYSGRFWHRPAPKDPAFVKEGDILEPGRTLGLIEVMKTFTHLSYEAQGELPSKARIIKLLAADGDEVSAGDPLIEVEGA